MDTDPRIVRLEAEVHALRKELKLRVKAHMDIHDEIQKALVIARESIDHRLDSMNEFRQQLRDQTATFVTRDSSDLLRDQYSGRIRDLEGQVANLHGRLWAIGAGMTVIAIGLSAAVGFLNT